jgi:hypothetical protein
MLFFVRQKLKECRILITRRHAKSDAHLFYNEGNLNAVLAVRMRERRVVISHSLSFLLLCTSY